MNTVSVIGTLTKDVELRYAQNGTAIGNFSIAWNKKFSQNGKIVEKTSYFDVVCYGKMAEHVAEFFHKGSRIGITGELEQQRWQAGDGGNRSKVVIRLAAFDFIDRKQDAKKQGGGGGQQTGGYRQPDPQYRKPTQPPSHSPAPPEMDVDEDQIPF